MLCGRCSLPNTEDGYIPASLFPITIAAIPGIACISSESLQAVSRQFIKSSAPSPVKITASQSLPECLMIASRIACLPCESETRRMRAFCFAASSSIASWEPIIPFSRSVNPFKFIPKQNDLRTQVRYRYRRNVRVLYRRQEVLQFRAKRRFFQKESRTM